jgi:hypothetical protein
MKKLYPSKPCLGENQDKRREDRGRKKERRDVIG